MKSLKKYWIECFKWNTKLNKRDFWVGMILSTMIATAVIVAIEALDLKESIRFPSVMTVIMLYIAGLWMALIRRLLDVGYPRLLVLTGFIPFINMGLWLFALMPGKVPYSEEELDKKMVCLLDQMSGEEKGRLIEKYTSADTPYLKYSCIEREEERHAARKGRTP